MPIKSTYLSTPSGGSILLTVSWYIISQDYANNTSKIGFTAQIQNPNNWDVYLGYSQPYVNLTIGTTSETPGWNYWSAGDFYVPNMPANFNDSMYREYNIPHKADGTLSCYAIAGYWPNGASGSYIPEQGGVRTDDEACPKIPRVSNVNSYVFGSTWDEGYVINYTKSVSSYTHTARIAIYGGKDLVRVNNYQSGTSLSLPESAISDIWAYAADKNNVVISMNLETWNGNVKIGDSQASTKTFAVDDPITVTYSIEETSLQSKGVKNTDFVTYIGSKRIRVTATCEHSKPKIFVECGGFAKEKLDCVSGMQYSFDFNDLRSANYKVYATNQRPNSKIIAVDTTGNLINYFTPSIIFSEVKRTNETASNGFINFQAIAYNGKIGNITCSKLSYKIYRGATMIINESGTLSGNKLAVNKPIVNVSYKERLIFTIELTDDMGTKSEVYKLYLPESRTVLAYGKKQVNIDHILKLGTDDGIGVLGLTPVSGIKYGKVILSNSNYPAGQNFFKAAEFKWVKGISYECRITILSIFAIEEIRLRMYDNGSRLVHDMGGSYYYGTYRYGIQVIHMNNKNIELWYHINGGTLAACTIVVEYIHSVLPTASTTDQFAYNNIKVLGEFPFKKIADGVSPSNIPGAVYASPLNNKMLFTLPVGTLIYNNASGFNPVHIYGGSWHKFSNEGWRRDS